MIKRNTKVYAIAFFAVALLCACSQNRGEVIAKIDGTQITVNDLKIEMQMSRGKYDPALLANSKNFEQFRTQTLGTLIQEAILLNRAHDLGIRISREDLKKLKDAQIGSLPSSEIDRAFREHGIDSDSWEESQKKRLAISQLIRREVTDRIPISRDSIETYYRKHTKDFRQPTQFRARQIIVDSREKADEIMSKLKRGEDFSQLAREHSLSPDGKRGGDLGYFDASSYPTVFAEICQQLNIGEMSDVVVTDYGYQIFQLLDRRQAYQRPLKEVEPMIRERLKEEKSDAAFEEWFTKLSKKATIYINEEVLKGVTLEEKNG